MGTAILPLMEANLAGDVFESVTNLASRWREGWVERWAPQDGRFRPTPAADGEPKNGRWEMIYWLGGVGEDARTAACLLESMGEGYEILYDTQSMDFAVLTDYIVPTLQLLEG
jgi:hypothetical protein